MGSTKTGKLKSLKDFLSSTRSLSQSQSSGGHQSQRYKSHHQLQGNSTGTPITVDNKKNSVSLFDLVDSESSRPNSIYNGTHSSNGFAFKSVSTYGLSARDHAETQNDTLVQRSPQTSKNPAVRLYYTIRAKFQKRKRDRGNRIVDSKSSDFGPYIPSNRSSDNSAITLTGNEMFNSPTQWYDSDKTLTSSQPKSMHSLDGVDLLEDSFMKPLSYRNDIQENQAFNNSSIMKTELDSSNASLNNICRASTSSGIVPNSKETPKSVVSVPLRSKALTSELCDLLHYGWYWGGLSKDEAEEKLKGEPDGAFVVRDSSSDHYLLSLSFNSNGKTLHTRIEYRNGLFCFYSSETECFPSVAELIEYWITTSQQGAFCYIKSRRTDVPSYPVCLSQPVSRFTEVKSLKYLSRFVIRQYVRLDLIPQLPLPQTLIGFIGESRYI